MNSFATWLRSHNYAETTIRTTVAGARYALERAQAGQANVTHEKTPGQVKLYLAFLNATNERIPQSVYASLEKMAAYVPPQGGFVGKRKRKRAAVSHPDDDWTRLLRALDSDDTIEGRVLDVAATTGLRVGDLLRLSITDLRVGLRTGTINVIQKADRVRLQPVDGAGGTWEKLDTWIRDHRHVTPSNVAEAVCPDNPSPLGGDCAYQRVNRHLKRVGKDLGLNGRIHLHRLRRTLLVQAHKLTRDMRAVAELAGHEAGSGATARYVDEPMPERTAELQKALREKFGRNK